MSNYDGLGGSKSISDVKKLLKGLQSDEEVRLMFDKNKEMLKTNVTSKATAINTSCGISIIPNSNKSILKCNFNLYLQIAMLTMIYHH